MYAIGLISWAASEGSMVSSLICDHWLTRKLETFMGSTNRLELQHDVQLQRTYMCTSLFFQTIL